MRGPSVEVLTSGTEKGIVSGAGSELRKRVARTPKAEWRVIFVDEKELAKTQTAQSDWQKPPRSDVLTRFIDDKDESGSAMEFSPTMSQ